MEITTRDSGNTLQALSATLVTAWAVSRRRGQVVCACVDNDDLGTAKGVSL